MASCKVCIPATYQNSCNLHPEKLSYCMGSVNFWLLLVSGVIHQSVCAQKRNELKALDICILIQKKQLSMVNTWVGLTTANVSDVLLIYGKIHTSDYFTACWFYVHWTVLVSNSIQSLALNTHIQGTNSWEWWAWSPIPSLWLIWLYRSEFSYVEYVYLSIHELIIYCSTKSRSGSACLPCRLWYVGVVVM